VICGKAFVVTGAAGGIGRTLVQALLRQKAIVWAWDQDVEGLEHLRAEAAKVGGEIRVCSVDISKEENVRRAMEQAVTRDKRIHGWVNNAGISGLGDFEKMPAERFQKVFEVNVGGVVAGTRVALEHMEAKGAGVIVNMASVAGFVPAPYLTAYSASKHAVVGFTRALREELRIKQSPVRLVLVSPGFVDTPMLEKGSELGFPAWLNWTVGSAESVSQAIVKALRTGQEEVTPTWNGKLVRGLHTFFPRTTRRGANMFLAGSFKDWLLNRYQIG